MESYLCRNVGFSPFAIFRFRNFNQSLPDKKIPFILSLWRVVLDAGWLAISTWLLHVYILFVFLPCSMMNRKSRCSRPTFYIVASRAKSQIYMFTSIVYFFFFFMEACWRGSASSLSGRMVLCSSRRLDWTFCMREKKSSSGTVGAGLLWWGRALRWSSIRDPYN